MGHSHQAPDTVRPLSLQRMQGEAVFRGEDMARVPCSWSVSASLGGRL